jgi:polyisoprenoid-binding protein YceI
MAIAMCCVALGLLAAPPREFRIDAGHSTVEFEIPFLYGHVRGRFDDVRGSVLSLCTTGSVAPPRWR